MLTGEQIGDGGKLHPHRSVDDVLHKMQILLLLALDANWKSCFVIEN